MKLLILSKTNLIMEDYTIFTKLEIHFNKKTNTLTQVLWNILILSFISVIVLKI